MNTFTVLHNHTLSPHSSASVSRCTHRVIYDNLSIFPRVGLCRGLFFPCSGDFYSLCPVLCLYCSVWLNRKWVSRPRHRPPIQQSSDWSLGQNSFLILAQRVDNVEYNPKIYGVSATTPAPYSAVSGAEFLSPIGPEDRQCRIQSKNLWCLGHDTRPLFSSLWGRIPFSYWVQRIDNVEYNLKIYGVSATTPAPYSAVSGAEVRSPIGPEGRLCRIQSKNLCVISTLVRMALWAPRCRMA
jgi:hypothetical protein